jgi:transposase
MEPSPEQADVMLGTHCAHARFVWNLALEVFDHGAKETYGEASRRTRKDGTAYIHQKHRPVRKPPGFAEQCRMLTEARAEHDWLREGSVNVQQQALRDFDQARKNFLAGAHGYPRRRKKFHDEGFRITDFTFGLHVRRLNRNWGEVQIPKVGWVRFRWSRDVPEGVKSFRVTRDRSGRWHLAFAAIPEPIPGPGTGEVVGIDRGVRVTAALSTGEKLHCPGLSVKEHARLRKAQRRAGRAPKGSGAGSTEYAAVARLKAREADIRKDWCEKTSTDIARRFDVIRVENLKIRNMTATPRPKPDPDQQGAYLPNGSTAKAGLNRAILAQGWGMLVKRLEDKAPGRVEKVNPRYTSLRCSDCGWIDKNSRQSQAGFVCTNCGFTCNADVNASINIAAGHAGGTTRGNPPSVRKPQLTLSSA